VVSEPEASRADAGEADAWEEVLGEFLAEPGRKSPRSNDP
jgi:hypothetical protein